tara:strand:- start:460 stop:750 length:291 start_codon:yes stop_codon:yes gene_type:complete
MINQEFIPIMQLCDHYLVEKSLFLKLHDAGLIEITTYEKKECLHQDRLYIFEKIIRIHKDLNINIEGIDAVLNLLERINRLDSELRQTKTRLSLYE